MSSRLAPAITISALGLFWLAVAQHKADTTPQQERPVEIVVSGPVQILLYAGDRFLAANVESIRAAAATMATTSGAQDFRLRAHQTVSRLNPCHEDNYWVGNASLSWGGLEEHGFDLLFNAMHCRYWDEWPAFFYGFNQHFFRDNVTEARRAVDIAAQRSTDNAAMFHTFSIMLATGKVNNIQMALEMLKHERDDAKDAKLREMLNLRVIRLSGLISLRDAQTAFEERFGKPLTQPQELLESGLLNAFPNDPLQIGYEFREQRFHLKQMKIP